MNDVKSQLKRRRTEDEVWVEDMDATIAWILRIAAPSIYSEALKGNWLGYTQRVLLVVHARCMRMSHEINIVNYNGS